MARPIPIKLIAPKIGVKLDIHIYFGDVERRKWSTVLFQLLID